MAVHDEKLKVEQQPTRVSTSDVDTVDTREAIRRNTHYLLLEEMDAEFETAAEEPLLRAHLERRLDTLLGHEAAPLSEVERRELTSEIVDGLLGNGPLDALMGDPTVTEIMVNGPRNVYVERSGKIYPYERAFVDAAHLGRVIEHLLTSIGRRADVEGPVVDARLPDGTVLNIIMPPLSIGGPALTLRKPVRDPFTVDDLIAFGTMSDAVAEFLAACVQGRLNMLVSGGMRSGKTTLLNVLAANIPIDERIVTIEDATELGLSQQHVLRLATRPSGVGSGSGASARDLVVNSLRMRPDRIIVGEIKAEETFELLQAMNAGHDGTLSTVYAASPRGALDRVEVMSLMGGANVQRAVVREQVASALDVIVHLARLRDGTRRVVQISEVGGPLGDSIEINDLFRFDSSGGLDDDGRFRGHIRPTGMHPRFAGRLEELGVELPRGLFG